MPRTRSHAVGLALTLAAVVAATSCSAGASTPPPVAVAADPDRSVTVEPGTDPVPLPPLEEPGAHTIHWADCTQHTRQRLGLPQEAETRSYECGSVTGPLDSPEQPNFGTATTHVLRVGTGAVPLVVLNDVGGAPGSLYAARLAEALPAELLETFSLIGVDRRGTGMSDPISCVRGDDRENMVGFDPAVTDVAGQDSLHSSSSSAAKECTWLLEYRARAFDPARTAGDLEVLRLELGMSRINAIARGDGSEVLVSYAQRFPDHVGRVVLDGVPDLSSDALARAEERAATAERAFEAFTSSCAARADCPLGPDPGGAVAELAEVLRREPLLTSDAMITPGTLTRVLLDGLAVPEEWPEVAEAVAAARDGDGVPLGTRLRDTLWEGPLDPPRFDASLVTRCNASALRLPPNQVAELSEEWHADYPTFGGLFAQELLHCTAWPVPYQGTEGDTVRGAPPVMVVSTATDPVTPGPATRRMAGRFDSAVLVDWQGTGHGGLARSSCVTDAAVSFLVDGEAPENDVVCPP
ncbi:MULTISPECIES: alpha/beta hydrolase [Actinoalloteichus]|uniref:TAP-like protein n=1 Tax=Actinoalloteichus caeruleus DSM 43889 TaxID=1120930 RepID=A0ABT1JGT2_ACTCY|nr:alpha/beta hydrolase [Actinoalloteichus caeruleus]MCP2331720.1 TAP-like protein [Actinoalloteichus caeruleus DSM 43889]